MKKTTIVLLALLLCGPAHAGYSIHQVSRNDAATVTDATSRYYAVHAACRPNTTEINEQVTFRTGNGTADKAGIYIEQNDVGSASTCALRVNAASSSLSISITANTTGLFENTSSSATITANDEINWIVTVPAVGGTHTIDPRLLFFRFLAASNTYQRLVAEGDASPYGTTVANMINIGGSLIGGSTEANAQYKTYTAGTMQKGFAYLSANTRD